MYLFQKTYGGRLKILNNNRIITISRDVTLEYNSKQITFKK